MSSVDLHFLCHTIQELEKEERENMDLIYLLAVGYDKDVLFTCSYIFRGRNIFEKGEQCYEYVFSSVLSVFCMYVL